MIINENDNKPWEIVQEAFGSEPIVRLQLDNFHGIYVERYICKPMKSEIQGLPVTAIVCQFGGSKVEEGNNKLLQRDFFPTLSAVIPAFCSTYWKFKGFVDFAVFYFPKNTQEEFCQTLEKLTKDHNKPLQINDPLIASSALQVTEELIQHNCSSEFIKRLILIILEQSCKILNGSTSVRVKPEYGQLGRIQTIISFIQANLNKSLSNIELATQLGLSETHFRRLFLQATGTTCHKFIQKTRLNKARELLINTSMPIVQIVDFLGYRSQSHLTSRFKHAYSITPAKYRQLFIKS